MALESKKGGPYTKPEQEKRRDKVFRLYFEYGYPAVRIAKLLNVNRNTINEDIRHFRSEMYEENKAHSPKTGLTSSLHDWNYSEQGCERSLTRTYR